MEPNQSTEPTDLVNEEDVETVAGQTNNDTATVQNVDQLNGHTVDPSQRQSDEQNIAGTVPSVHSADAVHTVINIENEEVYAGTVMVYDTNEKKQMSEMEKKEKTVSTVCGDVIYPSENLRNRLIKFREAENKESSEQRSNRIVVHSQEMTDNMPTVQSTEGEEEKVAVSNGTGTSPQGQDGRVQAETDSLRNMVKSKDDNTHRIGNGFDALEARCQELLEQLELHQQTTDNIPTVDIVVQEQEKVTVSNDTETSPRQHDDRAEADDAQHGDEEKKEVEAAGFIKSVTDIAPAVRDEDDCIEQEVAGEMVLTVNEEKTVSTACGDVNYPSENLPNRLIEFREPESKESSDQILRSTNSDVNVHLTFINDTDRTLYIIWIDHDGYEMFTTSLLANEGYGQYSFLTHPFIISIRDGVSCPEDIIGIYIPRNGGHPFHRITIRSMEEVDETKFIIDSEPGKQRYAINANHTMNRYEKYADLYMQQRYHSVGDGLKQWSPQRLQNVVNDHIEKSWGSTLGKAQLIFGGLMSIGSAALNLWYLQSNIYKFKRDSDIDYNLTELLVSIIEVAVVYFLLLFFLVICIVFLIQRQTRLLIQMVHFVNMIGKGSVLLSITKLRMGPLKKHVNMFLTLMRTYYCVSNARFSENFSTNRIVCCRCFYFMFFPMFLLLFILPLVVPAALLLKLLQIRFLLDTYVMYWGYREYFAFFGFLNNIAGLTASEGLQIAFAERALLMPSNLQEDKKEMKDPDKGWRTINRFVAKYVWDKVGLLPTFFIINGWFTNPEMYLALLRCIPPVDNKPFSEGHETKSSKEQLKDHINNTIVREKEEEER